MILVGLSFGALYYSRKSIEARRYEDFKIRQRMQEANIGDYSLPARYSNKSDNK